LFSVDQNDYDKIKGNPNLTIIGHMAEENEGLHLITRGEEKIPMKAQGWNSMDEE
jgi:thiamine-monophosphate kinase